MLIFLYSLRLRDVVFMETIEIRMQGSMGTAQLSIGLPPHNPLRSQTNHSAGEHLLRVVPKYKGEEGISEKEREKTKNIGQHKAFGSA
jgi:hypothetical protein